VPPMTAATIGELSTRAQRFRALHERDRPFVIPNPWDVGSARLLAAAGFDALATTSAGFAASVGTVDGALDADATLRHVATIAAATPLPLSADLEDGLAAGPAAVAELFTAAGRAGAVGGSIEDLDGWRGELFELGRAVERVTAAVEAARALPFDFVVTARCECFVRAGRPDLARTIERLQAYQEAGADVLYAPGLRTLEEVAAVCAAVSKPVNVLARADITLAQLAAAGAQRVSVGGALTWVAAGALADAASAMRDGDFSQLARRVPVEEWLA
jgi:2-methylisocitrate lyase-like PEP mutase family enzyme